VKTDKQPAAPAAVPAAADSGVLAKSLKGAVCHDCGQRVFVSREGYWEHYDPNTRETWVWHHDCRPPWQTSDD
jgi:hypothetical protein